MVGNCLYNFSIRSMYQQTFNTIVAKLYEKFATQDYECFVNRRIHGRTDRLIPVSRGIIMNSREMIRHRSASTDTWVDICFKCNKLSQSESMTNLSIWTYSLVSTISQQSCRSLLSTCTSATG